MRAIVLVLILVLSCSPAVTPELAERQAKAAPASTTPQSTVAATAANNAFACDLYQILAEDGGNQFFSPYSIASALTMARVGAGGATAAQMDEVLHCVGMTPATGQHKLATALRPGQPTAGPGDAAPIPHYQLQIANALWGQQGFTFAAPFLKVLDRELAAPLQTIDFTDPPAARKRINDWVATHTAERIKDILPPGLPKPDTKLALANAIYLKAAWDDAFDANATKPARFTLLSGKSTALPLMQQTRRLRYSGDDQVQVAAIPFQAGELSLLLILPRQPTGLQAVEQRLSPAQIKIWCDGLRTTKVQLKLPRLHLSTEVNLAAALPKLGMADAFNRDRADFSAMTDADQLYLDAAMHRAFLALDEKGVEAAAATLLLAGPTTDGGPGKPTPMFADRPFLFLIRHHQTGTILFAGRIADPRSDS